jgi:hypothetical protein
MSIQSRRELLDQIMGRYRKTSSKKEKQKILDEFVGSAKYHRKYAVMLLNHGTFHWERKPLIRPPRRYDDRVSKALVKIWQMANRICSKRLVPFLPEFVKALERFGHISFEPEVREKLLSLSPATVDRLLRHERYPEGKGKSTTRPGSLIKHRIAVRTFFDWNDLSPGFFEADLVAHCGDTVAGTFLNTLVLTDIATGWTECLALLRRSESDVILAVDEIRQVLPFPLLGLDTDNGGEFINHEMLRYCQHEKITFTRSRSYRKNDQAHVEEKNGSIVLRLIGYDRYEGVEAWHSLQELYLTLRQYVNFFQPSMKLVEKEKQQGQVSKKYDSAQTPYQRLLTFNILNENHKSQLQRHYENLDPVALLTELETGQNRFWTFSHGRTPTELTNNSSDTVPTAQTETISIHLPNPQRQEVPRFYRRTPRPAVTRYWRTRKDPFEQVWPQVRIQLQIEPGKTAKMLFQELQAQYPGIFPDGQLRTLQRRVCDWRREFQGSDRSIREGFYANAMENPINHSVSDGP